MIRRGARWLWLGFYRAVSRVLGASASTTTLTAGTFGLAGNGVATSTQTLTVRDAAGVVVPNATVTGITAANKFVSASLTTVSASTSTILNDGVATAYISVVLKNTEGNPVVGMAAAQCVLAVTGTGNTVTQPTGVSNASGVITGSFVTTSAAVHVCSFTIAGLAITATASVTASGSGAAAVFTDNFTGGFNPSGGFTYAPNGSQVPVAVSNAVRFRFGPDAAGADSNSELRATFDTDVAEWWMEYDLTFPANYVHRNDIVDTDNNKFGQFWYNTYADTSGGTCQVGLEMDLSGTDTVIRMMARRWDYNQVDSSGPNFSPTGQGAVLVGTGGVITLGVAAQIRLHCRAASAFDAEDGVWQMWVNGTILCSITTARLWNFDVGSGPGASTLFRNYYLMGYSNSGYLAQTDFIVDNLKIYYASPGW